MEVAKYTCSPECSLSKEMLLEILNTEYIPRNIIGDILLSALGISGSCIVLNKVKDDPESINIGYTIFNGDDYIATFSLDEIEKKLAGKTLKIKIDLE